MTSGPSDQDHDSDARDILERARLHVDAGIHLFQGILARIRAGEDVPYSDAEKAARALHAATQTFFTIRMKLDEEKSRQARSRRDGDIDLDEARDQVRRLLDRLRACVDPG